MTPFAGIQGFSGFNGGFGFGGGGESPTMLGGSMYFYGNMGMYSPNMVADTFGNYYVVCSADYAHVGGNPPAPSSQPVSRDIFLVKFNSNFEEQWKVLIGTAGTFSVNYSGWDGGWIGPALAVGVGAQASGVYVGFTSRTGPYTYEVHHAKFATSNGSLLWSKRVSDVANGNEIRSAGIGVDNSGNVYASVFADGASGGQGSSDFVLIKYNSSGTAQWQRGVGGSQQDEPRFSITATNGDTYVCGYSNRFQASPPPGEFNYNWQGSLAKWNSSGVLQWHRNVGDSSQSTPSSAQIDRLSVLCFNSNQTMIYAAGYSRGDQVLVVKYNTSGTLQWSRLFESEFLSNSADIDVKGIAVDSSDNVYVTMNINRFYQSFYTPVGGVIKIDSSGTLQDQNFYRFLGATLRTDGFGGPYFSRSAISGTDLVTVGQLGTQIMISKLPLDFTDSAANSWTSNFVQPKLFKISLEINTPLWEIGGFGGQAGWYAGTSAWYKYDISTQTFTGSNSEIWSKFVRNTTTTIDEHAAISSGYTSTLTIGAATASVQTIEVKALTDNLLFELDARDSSSWSGSGTTWNDISGNSRNFTLVAGPTGGTNSVVFDGSNDYGKITDASWMPDQTDNWTFEAYVNIHSWTQLNSAADNLNFIFSKTKTNDQHYSVGFLEEDGYVYMVAASQNQSFGNVGAIEWDEGVRWQLPGTADSWLNSYHHFVWAYEGNVWFGGQTGYINMYVDGLTVAQINNTTRNYIFGDNDADLRIMCFDPNNNPYTNAVDGEVRVLRMYSTTLAPGQVNRNYQNCLEQMRVVQYDVRSGINTTANYLVTNTNITTT